MPDLCKMATVSTSRRLARAFQGIVFATALIVRAGCLAGGPAPRRRSLMREFVPWDEGLPQVAS